MRDSAADATAFSGTSAVSHVERAVMVLAVLGRTLAFATFAIMPGPGAPDGLVALAAVQTTVFVAVCLHRRRIPPWLAVVDVVVTAGVQWPGSAGAVEGGPGYNYLVLSVPVAGFAPLPFTSAAGLAALAVLAGAANRMVVLDSPGLIREVVPDVLNPAWVVLLVWCLASSARVAARRVDESRSRAVATAARLAAQRERVRQADLLRGRLMGVMDELARGDAITDRVVLAQVRSEADWLRRFVELDEAGGPRPLCAGLRDLVAEWTAGGLPVRIDCPDDEPEVGADRTEALLGAVHEALNNVAKHAGNTTVQVTLDTDGDVVRVAVTDDGTGFDATRVRMGIGSRESIHRRLTEVGGAAVVTSEPGRGTRVSLTVPLAR